MNNDKYDIGLEKNREIYGQAGEGVIKNLRYLT
jgi:hypothetical protein